MHLHTTIYQDLFAHIAKFSFRVISKSFFVIPTLQLATMEELMLTSQK